MTTLLQTSESKLAVRSRTSLCLREGNPPFGQDRAKVCLIQTAQHDVVAFLAYGWMFAGMDPIILNSW